MDDSESGRPMTGRTKRYFEIARRTAAESIFEDYRHGALLPATRTALNAGAIVLERVIAVMQPIMQSWDVF